MPHLLRIVSHVFCELCLYVGMQLKTRNSTLFQQLRLDATWQCGIEYSECVRHLRDADKSIAFYRARYDQAEMPSNLYGQSAFFHSSLPVHIFLWIISLHFLTSIF